MRAMIFAAAAAAVLASGAARAESWQEYSFGESGFAAQFPGKPEIVDATYESSQAVSGPVKERRYSFNQGGVVYLVRVADFSRTGADEQKTIDEAASALMGKGRLTHDLPARVSWHYGREIRVEDENGTSYTDAILFVDKKLYQIEVVFPAVNSDPVGDSGIQFFQTAFRFL
jgi:hypothetical protein